MASVIFRDMKRVSFSCSSSSSASISNSIVRKSPHLRDPKRKKSNSNSNSNPKSKLEPQKEVKNPKQNLISPVDSSRYLLNSNSSTKSKQEPQKDVRNPKQNLISPVDSSRYLLKSSRLQFDGSTAPSFIDLFPEPELVPVQKPASVLVPVKNSCNESKLEEEVQPKPVMLRSFSTRRQDQVVELRVSLHCKGCAGKVKKHISKMEGVTSYNIDLELKKVTITGDVTPLGVLSSVSKVKNAQFWNSSPARASVSF